MVFLDFKKKTQRTGPIVSLNLKYLLDLSFHSVAFKRCYFFRFIENLFVRQYWVIIIIG